MSISLKADRTLIRAGSRSRRYVRVELSMAEAPSRRLPVNLALVLDRSGSMEGPKIEMARAAVLRAISGLRLQDRFSVVAYDDKIDLLLPSSAATPAARAHAERCVKGLQARGATDLCGGWLRGCEQIGLHLAEEGVGRCLLLTDGLANQGIVDHDQIVRHATALRERRVRTTTFGVGADFDETLLRRMAAAGGGNFYFIEYAANIPDFLAGEVGDMLETVAPAATLLIAAGEGVTVASLNGFPCRRAGRAWQVDLGALVAGQSLDPILALTFPGGPQGRACPVTVSLVDDASEKTSRMLERCISVVFRYAGNEENDRQLREEVVEHRVAALYAARSSQEALERNRLGDFEGARRVLEACRRNIAEYVPDESPFIQAILDDLEARASLYSEDMSSLSRKTAYFDATLSLTARPRMPGLSP